MYMNLCRFSICQFILWDLVWRFVKDTWKNLRQYCRNSTKPSKSTRATFEKIDFLTFSLLHNIKEFQYLFWMFNNMQYNLTQQYILLFENNIALTCFNYALCGLTLFCRITERGIIVLKKFAKPSKSHTRFCQIITN